VDASITVDGIRDAARVIDPVFLNSPQFDCEPLSTRLGVTTVLKVETVNPIRSFKGRGTDYLLHRLGAGRRLVCASAGNFGQGMAYACRKRDVALTVFAARGASSLKVERMRSLGAAVELEGGDFDEAKDAARRRALDTGALFVEDGMLGPIGEGAGTIAVELLRDGRPLDAVFVAVGNGSLVNGVGTWLRHVSPATRVVGVCAEAAPAMAMSWRERRAVAAPSTTIADGIGVRVPVPEALATMEMTVDEMLLVPDAAMLDWMRALHEDAGLVVEPAAAAALCAIAGRAKDLAGGRVAAILTGGNLSGQQLRDWL
jgi:threonine dehydratase